MPPVANIRPSAGLAAARGLVLAGAIVFGWPASAQTADQRLADYYQSEFTRFSGLVSAIIEQVDKCLLEMTVWEADPIALGPMLGGMVECERAEQARRVTLLDVVREVRPVAESFGRRRAAVLAGLSEPVALATVKRYEPATEALESLNHTFQLLLAKAGQAVAQSARAQRKLAELVEAGALGREVEAFRDAFKGRAENGPPHTGD